MDAVRRGYESWASSYDDRDPSTILDEPLVLALCRPLDGRKVLDVACGTGRYARLLGRHGARVFGADASKNMLARARLPCVQASAERLPFAGGSFDRITCGLLFDHVADPRAPFAEMARVLAAGGRAVVTTIHPDMQRLTGADIEAAGVTIPGRIHEIGALESAAAAAGLQLQGRYELAADERLAVDARWRLRVGRPALLVLAFSRRG
jgi:ubiquinone/menaquinone biosynthesis C-methylase UbiE